MLDKIKRTVKQTIIYSLGNVSTKLVGLLLLPLYTSQLTTTEYGILSIIEITSQLLLLFFSFSLAQAMLRWSSTEKDKEKDKSIIFSAFTALIIVSILLLVLLIPLKESFSILIFGNKNFSNYFYLLVIWSSLGIINRLPESLLRLRERAVFYSVLMVSKFFVILISNLYLLLAKKMGIEGIVLSQIIGEIFLLVISFPFVFKNMKPVFSFTVLKEMFYYGFPLALAGAANLILGFGDRYIIAFYLSFAGVGIYSLAQKIAGVITVFILHSFQQGFIPIAFKMFNEENSSRFFSKVLTYFTLFLVFSALGLSLFSEELLIFLTTPVYYEAYKLVPFISLAMVIKGINILFTLGFDYAKRTTTYAVIFILGTILTVVLNIILIPLFDIYGAAYAMLISYSVIAALSFYYSNKLLPINYEFGKISKMLVVGIVLYLIGYFLPAMNIVIKIGIKFILLISLPFILYFFNFYEEIELLRIKQSWVKWRNPKRWRDNIKQIKL